MRVLNTLARMQMCRTATCAQCTYNSAVVSGAFRAICRPMRRLLPIRHSDRGSSGRSLHVETRGTRWPRAARRKYRLRLCAFAISLAELDSHAVAGGLQADAHDS
jgi:hypothetical protein